MINPRVFCREKGYTKTIGLTYAFDPLFFERVILRDLWQGQSTDVTIIGDLGQLQKAISDCSNQLLFLGKKYLLSPAAIRGTFHPKLLLRVGSKGAKLLLGSGNLTAGGWGGNHELGFTIDLAPNPESVFIINSVLNGISPYITEGAVVEATGRLQEFDWFSSGQQPVDNTVVITNPNLPLAEEVWKRWDGRRFDSLIIFSGSTDDKGAFIRWCYERFGIKKCILAVSERNSSLQPDLVKDIPVETKIAFFKGKPLHAKFYWFDGIDGQASIMGSANCSAAAWLIPPNSGGNVEAICIHDNPNPDDFNHILSLLPETHLPISDAPRPIDITECEKTNSEYHLLSVILNRALSTIVATFNSNLPENAIVKIHCLNSIYAEMTSIDRQMWLYEISESASWSEETLLAEVIITIDNIEFVTPLHWVNDIVSLSHAIRDKSILEPFKRLGEPKSSSENAKILNDIANVASVIFSDKGSFRDAHTSRKESEKVLGEDIKVSAIKPEDLIRSLKDIHEQSKTSYSTGYGLNLSLIGVVRALFQEQEDQNNMDDEVEAANDSENPDYEDKEGDTSKINRKIGEKSKKEEPVEIPTEKYRNTLLKQMDDFFSKMISNNFATSCTATKLVQAVAFPLAIALIGERGKWLSTAQARYLITKTVDALFNINITGTEGNGLIKIVGNKYRNEGFYNFFLQVIGDGSLWVTLTASLANIQWSDSVGAFEQGVLLKQVFDCNELRTDMSVTKLNLLISKSQIAKARELITLKAPKIVVSLRNIEDLLQNNADILLRESHIRSNEGDILWNKTARWGVVKKVIKDNKVIAYLHMRGEDKMIITKGYYINLRGACSVLPEIREYLAVFGLSY